MSLEKKETEKHTYQDHGELSIERVGNSYFLLFRRISESKVYVSSIPLKSVLGVNNYFEESGRQVIMLHLKIWALDVIKHFPFILCDWSEEAKKARLFFEPDSPIGKQLSKLFL